MCGTYDETTGNMCYYVDGILKGTNTYDGSYASSWTNGVYIAHDPNNSTDECYTKGYIQDVRIYDHTLSAREVYEISKALVLHFPMNIIGENILGNNGHISTVGAASGITANIMSDKSVKYVTTSGNGNWSNITCSSNDNANFGNKLKSGDTITVSFDILIESGSGIPQVFLNAGNSYASFVGDRNLVGKWQRVYCNRTLNDFGTSYGNLSWHFGWSGIVGTFYIDNLKIEKGTTNYPIAYEGDNSKINDCSGYNRHGTVTSVQPLTVMQNNPKYNCCTKFNGHNSYFLAKNPLYNNVQPCTFTFWFKPDSSNASYNTIISNTYPHSGFWISANSEGAGCWSYNAGTYIYGASGTLSNDTWYFICWQYLGNNQYQWWLNGNKITTTIFGTAKAPTFTEYLNVGGCQCSDSATSSSRYDQYGSLCDLRVYANVLSEQDIKDLYNVSAVIDDLGSLHTFELNETSSNLLRYENTIQYTNPNNTSTRGLMVERNGIKALAFQATDTYFAAGDERNSKLLYNMFLPNTQYLFDLWLDTDDVIYNGNNVSGGFYIIYTDGTTYNGFIIKGANPGETAKGFQHHVYISDANKTVKRVSIYYYVSVTFYVRADSFICALNNVNINQTGVIDSGQFIEDTDVAYIGNADFHANNIIEI